MTTHAKIIIKENQQPLVTFYKHSDGYLESLGKEIAEFLKDMVIVNGYSVINGKQANGMGCLAAQLCQHFKEDVGEFYITFNNQDPEEYNYSIGKNYISVTDIDDKLLFVGNWQEYYRYVSKLKD